MQFLRMQPESFYTLLWGRMTSPTGPKDDFRPVFCELSIHTIRVKSDYLEAYLLAGSMCDPPEAERWLLDAVELFPFTERSWLDLAQYELRAGYPSKAIPLIERALEINDKNPKSDVLMASALEQLGKTSEALEWYASALDKDPNNSRYRDSLAQACSRLGPAEVCR